MMHRAGHTASAISRRVAMISSRSLRLLAGEQLAASSTSLGATQKMGRGAWGVMGTTKKVGVEWAKAVMVGNCIVS
eukprot:366244-Chlamydomonas_euryale.AAC.10